MKILKQPFPNLAPETIFEKCVCGYRSRDKQDNLRQCTALIKQDSANYAKFIPSEIDKFTKSTLPNDVSEKDLTKVYDDKFVPNNAPGRTYYNAIIKLAERGVCPICGLRMVSTLDHYLPKSKVPTLAVTPSNLIPSCRDCNMDKRSDMILDPMNTPVHLYFDEIPNGIWLHANLGSNMEASYYALCPEVWEKGLQSRVEKHLDFYNLHKLYSAHATQELAEKYRLWKRLLSAEDSTQLFEAIIEERKSTEAVDMNSWKAALYRSLEREFNKLKVWLSADICSTP